MEPAVSAVALFTVLPPGLPSTRRPRACRDLSAQCQTLAGVWEHGQLNKSPQVAPDALGLAATVTDSSSSLWWGSGKEEGVVVVWWEGGQKFGLGGTPPLAFSH